MNRQLITLQSEAHWHALRAEDLTSTDVAALFGLSPYKTAFELWHEKKSGERAAFEENERMKWGRRLEAAVAEGIAEDQGWAVRPFKEYGRIAGHRIGASFDYRVLNGSIMQGGVEVDTPDDAILEIKTVDFLRFRDGWIVDEGFIEAPAHIELQVQHQMLVSGLRRAYLGVMIGGNDIRVIERTADDAVHAGILARVAEFWRSVDDNNPPDPVMPDDADALIAMHQFAEPGKLLDARDDDHLAALLQQYHALGSAERSAAEQRKVIKAEILARIGDAEKVISSAGKVSASITGPCEVAAFTRAPFRAFRFTPNKPQEASP